MKTVKPATKWVMLAISYVILVTCFVPYISWGLHLTEIQQEIGLSDSQAGLLNSITALFGGVILPFAGMIGDRIGIKKIILLGVAAAALGQLVFALAPNFALLLTGRAITGIGVGLLFVGPYTMAVNWFERERKNGVALGIMFTSDGVGTAFAFYIFALLLLALGWRQGALAGAGLMAVVFIFALLLQDAPKYDAGTTTEQLSLPQIFSSRNVIVAALFFIGEWGIFAMVATWMPTILTENAGWDAELAGLFSSLYVLIGMITAIGFGLFSDRLGARKMLIVAAGAGMTLFMLLLTLALQAENYSLAVIALPLVGLAVYTGMPLALALAAESVPQGQAGGATGVILGIGFVVGGVVYPYVMGLIKETTGEFTIGFFAIVAATFVLNLIAAIFAKNTRLPQPQAS